VLTLRADRDIGMGSKSVAQLLVDLDVTRTHSRPHVSADKPYYEAQFKTLKFRSDFPARFGSIEDARAHCQEFMVVQQGAPSFRYRVGAARQAALLPFSRTHRTTRHRP
jgi:transposase InsO family protein